MSDENMTREDEIPTILANTKRMFSKTTPPAPESSASGDQPISFDQLEVCLRAAIGRLGGYEVSPNLETLCKDEQTPYHPSMVRLYDTFVNFGAHVRGDFKDVPIHKPKA